MFVVGVDSLQRRLSSERVVMQTTMGEIEFGFYAEESPTTTNHMLECFVMGLFDTNHIFRVDRGFVIQIASASMGRRASMNSEQQLLSNKKIKGEFTKKLKHVRGVLSMGRKKDPNSATNSFSILLGTKPHMDGKYTQFGEVTAGLSVLSEIEKVSTHKKGIFVMPNERIEILSTFIYKVEESNQLVVKPLVATTPKNNIKLTKDILLYLAVGILVGFCASKGFEEKFKKL